MEDATQFEIIEEVLDRAMDVAPDGWQELIIDYYIEGGNSAELKSYIIERNGTIKEEALGAVLDLDFLLRKLQAHLTQAGRSLFTRCKVHLTSEGRYDVSYSYDPVDWDALLVPDWNFFPQQRKSV